MAEEGLSLDMLGLKHQAAHWRGILRWPVLALLSILVFLLSACDSGEVSPEEQIKEMIAAGELAVENRSLIDLGALIADDYRDRKGRVWQDLRRIAAGYFMRHKSIHGLRGLAQILRIQFP